MKTTTKIVSVIIMLSIALSMFPLYASAAKDSGTPEEFYADTTKAMEELKKEEDKEFWIEKTEAKAKVNKYKQIVEMCVSCQINWKEKGNRDASSQRDQFLRDYGLIFNAEAKLN